VWGNGDTVSKPLKLLLTGALMFAFGAAMLIYAVDNRGQFGAVMEAFEFFIGFYLISSAPLTPYMKWRRKSRQ